MCPGRESAKLYVLCVEVSGSGNPERISSRRIRVGGACGPPPPVAAPLVPRCALLPAATPRVRAAALRACESTCGLTDEYVGARHTRARTTSPISGHHVARDPPAWSTLGGSPTYGASLYGGGARPH